MGARWKPNGKAIREARERLDWKQEELADAAGFSVNHISDLELEKTNSTTPTLAAIAKAIGNELRKRAKAAGKKGDAPDDPVEKYGTHLPSPIRGRGSKSATAKGPSLPKSTLQILAELESEEGAFRIITLPQGEFELLGPARMYMLLSLFADKRFRNTRFAVRGLVDRHRGIPEDVQPVLKVLTGEGARFNIVRKIRKINFYATVFARSDKHSGPLMDAWEALQRKPKREVEVTVLVRIFIKRPRGDWEGFRVLERDDKPIPRHWCLVVDEVVSVEPAPASPKEIV